jgi:hypothetical protein
VVPEKSAEQPHDLNEKRNILRTLEKLQGSIKRGTMRKKGQKQIPDRVVQRVGALDLENGGDGASAKCVRRITCRKNRSAHMPFKF